MAANAIRIYDHDADTNQLAYTCPSNVQFSVIRSILTLNSGQWYLNAAGSAGGTNGVLLLTPGTGTYALETTRPFPMWIVMQPGDTLYFSPGAGNRQYWISVVEVTA